MNQITVTVLTKNSSKRIKMCLEALVKFDEIIVLDNGSIDDTIEIVKTFKNIKLYKSEFIGFGPLKNLAISKAKYDWILSIDSDEIFSPDLVDEILSLKLDKYKIYSIKRDNYYNNKLIKCCNWGNDYVLRLFNKNITQFNDNQVHESLLLKTLEIVKLKNTFKHYSFDNASELLQKMDYYSTLWAKDNRHKKTLPIIAVLKSLVAFIKFYILKGGIFFGYHGFLISFSNASGVFYKYIKLYENNK